MKRILLGILGVCACHAYAQTFKEWQDPEINAVNRAPMHTDFLPMKVRNWRQKGMKELSGNFMSLNGNWKFNWVEHADARPEGFWKTDFNDKGWVDFPVPGVWELNGYDVPYTQEWISDGKATKDARSRSRPMSRRKTTT